MVEREKNLSPRVLGIATWVLMFFGRHAGYDEERNKFDNDIWEHVKGRALEISDIGTSVGRYEMARTAESPNGPMLWIRNCLRFGAGIAVSLSQGIKRATQEVDTALWSTTKFPPLKPPASPIKNWWDPGSHALPSVDRILILCSGSKKGFCRKYNPIGERAATHLAERIAHLQSVGVSLEFLEASCLGVCHNGPILLVLNCTTGERTEYFLNSQSLPQVETAIDRRLEKLFPEKFSQSLLVAQYRSALRATPGTYIKKD